jgi:hypothetical protein
MMRIWNTSPNNPFSNSQMAIVKNMFPVGSKGADTMTSVASADGPTSRGSTASASSTAGATASASTIAGSTYGGALFDGITASNLLTCCFLLS